MIAHTHRSRGERSSSTVSLGADAHDPANARPARSLAEGGHAHLPPVFVMNPYYTGLGIARCLHGHGLKVVALASERNAPGTRSRFFQAVIDVPNGRDDPQALCARLVELGRTLPSKPLLLPTRDLDVLFLHEHREALTPYYTLPQGASSPIMRMMDKLELARVARSLAIPTPKTFAADSADDLRIKAAELRFPVIMKPRFAYQWRKSGIWDRVGAQKAIIADCLDTLLDRYRAIAGTVNEVLVQEYVPGGDSDIVVCCGYIDEQGELLGHFTARKLRQDPPLLGTGCAVEATEVGAIVEPTRRLLHAFHYVGMAEVEYKYDRATGEHYLIEINPRHWDQHELGRLVGVNLSLIAYSHLVGRPQAPHIPGYRPGVRYRWIAERELVIGLLSQLSASLTNPKLSLPGKLRGFAALTRELVSLLSGRTIFSVGKISDPVPSLCWTATIMYDVLRYGWTKVRALVAHG